jgi:uncharacterized protein (TIGR03067 family)
MVAADNIKRDAGKEGQKVQERDAEKEDEKKMQGTWRLVSWIDDGDELPHEDVKEFTLIVKGKKWTIRDGDGKPRIVLGPCLVKQCVPGELKGTWKLDRSKKPSRYEGVSDSGDPVRGNYEINGDSMRWCWGSSERKFPTDFSAKAGSEQTSMVWKRAK